MSGKSGGGYSRTYNSTRSTLSSDEGVRKKAVNERKKRVHKARSTVHEKTERVKEDKSKLYDANLVKLSITDPEQGVNRVYIFVIDNSGSNSRIAQHLKDSAEYLTSVMQQLDPQAQFAYIYGSDHYDSNLMTQEIDYHFPNNEGAKILYSSGKNIIPANGGDEAEGFECILWDACDLKFGGAKEKHLVLITDQVAHGMGESSDDGCPLGRDWQDTKQKVYDTFDSFTVVGCSTREKIGILQRDFLEQSRVSLDLIDLSGIKEHQHRLGISGNALLFLVARVTGKQGVELFLSFLYEKWLSDPVFGAETDARAQEGIRRFAKYLAYPDVEIEEMMERIFI